MAGSYNEAHWNKQIAKYVASDWSLRPSPFAKLTKSYLHNTTVKILELGTGAGQDGLWFASQGAEVTLSDGVDAAFKEIQKRAAAQHITDIDILAFDITRSFPFDDASFDVVYAQLVLHYFDDETMRQIMAEVARVLKPEGIVALMVNTMADQEYTSEAANDQQIIELGGVSKRYFSVETLKPFVAAFEALLFDDKGRTPKDDVVGNSGMIQFIGRKKED